MNLQPTAGGLTGLAALTAALLAGPAHAGEVIFVDDDAPAAGDGTSWETAFRFLQDALAVAEAGGVSEIRVGQGVQLPDRDEANPGGTQDDAARFLLTIGVAVRGGYAGFGAEDPDARDAAKFETILDGDLLGNDEPDFENYDDNSDRIVQGVATDATVVLDGFTLRGAMLAALDIEGAAAIMACTFDANFTAVAERGGASSFSGCVIRGCRRQAMTTVGDPTMTDCLFTGNNGSSAFSYGGSPSVTRCDFIDNDTTAAVAASGGDATFTDCRFEGNTSDNIGAAVWLGDSDVRATLVGCVFEANSALRWGGAIGVLRAGSALTVTDCTFTGNNARLRGGAIYVHSSQNVAVTRCVFTGNTAEFGGGVEVSGYGAAAVLTECVFDRNTARIDGGGVLIFENATGELSDCLFTENEAAGEGGGVASIVHASLSISDTRFEANEAGRGGGVFSRNHDGFLIADCAFQGNRALEGGGVGTEDGAPAEIVDSTFVGNTAAWGGGVSNWSSRPVIDRCSFLGNIATALGGGVYNFLTSSADVRNSLFSGNVATEGGAIRGLASDDVIINCTLSGNTALFGGAFSSLANDDAVIANCILWNNGDEPIDSDTAMTVRYTDIEGGHPGPGNLDADPGFADAVGADGVAGTLDDDLRLTAESPAIDAGDGDALPFFLTQDLDGNPRYVDDPETPDTGVGDPTFIDLGAYELGSACVGDIDGDGAIGFAEVLAILAAWGPCEGCPEDIDGDGAAGFGDILFVLAAWGPCP